MATETYIQIKTNKIVEIKLFGSTMALFECGDEVELYTYLSSFNIFIKEDKFFIKTQGIMISSTGEVYRLYGGEQPPTEPSYLLLESGDFVLLEDASKILLQR